MAEILATQPGELLVLADLEHLSAELFDYVQLHTPFELLVPMKNRRSLEKQLRAIPSERFTRRWAGFATAKLPYKMVRSEAGPFFQFAHRTGERPDEYQFGAFLSTTDRDEVEAITLDYPKRWDVEESFNAHQALCRPGTAMIGQTPRQIMLCVDAVRLRPVPTAAART